MFFLPLFLLLSMWPPAQGQRSPASEETKTWAMGRGSPTPSPTLSPPYLHLPVFVDSKTLVLGQEHLSPTKGTGQEPLPEQVRKILLSFWDRTKSDPPEDSSASVKVSCRQKTMQVQLDRRVLGSGPHLHAQLGTCQPSKYTEHHLYFEYDLGMCGTKRTVSVTRHCSWRRRPTKVTREYSSIHDKELFTGLILAQIGGALSINGFCRSAKPFSRMTTTVLGFRPPTVTPPHNYCFLSR